MIRHFHICRINLRGALHHVSTRCRPSTLSLRPSLSRGISLLSPLNVSHAQLRDSELPVCMHCLRSGQTKIVTYYDMQWNHKHPMLTPDYGMPTVEQWNPTLKAQRMQTMSKNDYTCDYQAMQQQPQEQSPASKRTRLDTTCMLYILPRSRHDIITHAHILCIFYYYSFSRHHRQYHMHTYICVHVMNACRYGSQCRTEINAATIYTDCSGFGSTNASHEHDGESRRW